MADQNGTSCSGASADQDVYKRQEYEAAIAEFPIFLKPYTSFDLLRLGNVHSYDELLDVLKHTMYYAILLPYRVKKGEENDIDYTKIETQLQVQHYTHTFQVIDKTLKGKSRKAVKMCIRDRRIYR